MRKILALVLALCLTMTGCATAPAQNDSAEKTTLSVWAIESPAISDYATNGQTLWMETQTGIHVDYLAVPSQGWYTAFQSSVMSGEAVDIYLYPFSTMEAEMLGTQMNYIIPLEDLLTEENAPNITAILKADPQLKELITAPDGHIYTLFANDVYELTAYTQKLWVNRLFLEKYTADTGKELPQTVGEFRDMLAWFSTHDMNGDGELNEIPYIGQAGVDGMYNLFGSYLPANSSGNAFGCYTADDGSIVFGYQQEAFREALAQLRQMYADGLISPDSFTMLPDERYDLTSGDRSSVRAGVVSGTNAANVVRLSGEEDTMTYADYIPLPPLEGPDGVRTIMSTGETSVSLRNAITAQCADPVAAIRWLDAGYSETARLYSVFGGLEGVNWKYADGQTLTGDSTVIAPITDPMANNCWNGQGIACCVTEEDYQKMDIGMLATHDGLATYRANLAYRPYLVKNHWPSIVWAGDQAELGAEYAELNQLIQKAVTEYYTAVIIGQKDLQTDWDAYLSSLQDMGLSRYLELVSLYIQNA